MVWYFIGVYIIKKKNICANEWNIFSTREEKFRISKRPCNILYLLTHTIKTTYCMLQNCDKWPLLQYCKNIICLLALIFHELGLGNKGIWESTKIKSKLTWNQLWPVTYYNQRYIVPTFFRSPRSISNVGQSFILSHTGRYNNNSDLFVLAISPTIHVYPKLKTSEAGQGGYFP